MKKYLIIILSILVFGLVSCSTTNETTTILLTTSTNNQEEESPCKDTPLDSGCYVPSDDLDFISSTPDEYLINEDFESEVLNQQPMNWLLFSNSEYKTNGVTARIIQENSNNFVKMYSDGLQKPLYPQSAPTPTFIFTTKFNLDQTKAGVAYMDLMVPSVEGNSVTAGISTGAVNTISIVIDTDMSLLVKVGGPFFYYSQSGDGGDYYDTDIVLDKDTWYSFRFEWDAQINYLAAYLVDNEGDVLLFQGEFHISNRFNVKEDGQIMVPNVVKITMPFGTAGTTYLDNVRVERRGE